MPDGVTQTQFFERIRQLEEKIDQKHTSLRNSMEDHFLRMELAIAKHEDEDHAVEKRVTKLELTANAAAETAKTQAAQRGAIVSSVVATAFIAGWEIVKHAFGWSK